eukprot:72419_1
MIPLLISICIIQTIAVRLFKQPESRIVNGIPINANEYPWVVKLFSETFYQNISQSTGHCTASLIGVSPPTILTAAHCIDSYEYNEEDNTIRKPSLRDHPEYPDRNYTDYKILVHAFVNLTNNPYWSFHSRDSHYLLEITDLSGVYIHPDYDNNNTQLINGNDIALIILDDQFIEFPSQLLPQIPNEQLSLDEPCCVDNEEFTAIGYGDSQTNGFGTITIQKTTLKFINLGDCISGIFEPFLAPILQNLTRQYNYSIANNISMPFSSLDDFLRNVTLSIIQQIYILTNDGLCVIGNDTDICQGDSGGPLFRNIDDKQYIIGVVSATFKGCNSGDPSFYVSVAHHIDWIKETIAFVIDTSTEMPFIINTTQILIEESETTYDSSESKSKSRGKKKKKKSSKKKNQVMILQKIMMK